MALPFTAEQLQRNIDHDAQTCESLLSVLKEEQGALKKRDVDAVNEILDQKVPLLESLEKSAKLRNLWAQNAQSQNTEEGWAQLIEGLGVMELKTNWQTLKSLYKDVRAQNEVNGKLLSRHQATVTKVLDVMRGKTASPNLYNASGYSSRQAQSNTFGEV